LPGCGGTAWVQGKQLLPVSAICNQLPGLRYAKCSCVLLQAAQVDSAGVTIVRKSFDARKEKVFK
jgi:hypothetical protein